MPCNNIVEQIQIVLDSRDRLREYRFIKESCGHGVGASSLLSDYVCGLTSEQVLTLDERVLLARSQPTDDVLKFLYLKHLFAIQSVLAVYTGRASGGKEAICTVAEIRHDSEEVLIDANIDLGLVTDRIQACDGCSGCGTGLPPMAV
jgi:hypothetical protein